MSKSDGDAPGWPGIPPKWTSSAKSGVGTSLSGTSRVWFTLSHGIFNEIYYPRVDQACTRDLGLIVTDGRSFFSEEKRHTRQSVEYLAEGVPAYRLINTCTQGRYRIEKKIIASTERDAILQSTSFTPLVGKLEDYYLYVLVAPHLGNRGMGNDAWIGQYKGVQMLFARRGDVAVAVAISAPWLAASAGFVGVSDGWQDLFRHKQMTRIYSRAENGNVALTGEVDLHECSGKFVLAIGFGSNTAEAGQRALSSLAEDFEKAQQSYILEWQQWQQSLKSDEVYDPSKRDLFYISAAVLRSHEEKSFQGALIASLSIPWGFAKGDDDLGGYHLVWPRDLVEAAGGLLAAGARDSALRVLHYLRVTQEPDGHWPQNMWVDGTPYWNGIQMDEAALPILAADRAMQEESLTEHEMAQFWLMVRRAAGYLVRNGPVTPEDRWEMDAGYTPFTLAAEIAALLAAADWADRVGEHRMAEYLRETADYWNASIERWVYVTGTELDRELGVEGHYVRVRPIQQADAASPHYGFVPIKDRPVQQCDEPPAYLVSPDALALVRFGLRRADDPRILNTVRAIDATLKVDTPYGPAWRRYIQDLYGEHEDGSPFDGIGVGRVWPLLTGERAHYELAAGRVEEAKRLMKVMEAFANEGGMIPEQIWDAQDTPERELFFGRPSGSAMPLVWAHAEYIKLRRSLRNGRIFDMPRQTVERYLINNIGSPYAVWRFNNKCSTMPVGRTLRLETLEPALVHWSADHWQTTQDTRTRDTGLGVQIADLPTEKVSAGSDLSFYILLAGNKPLGRDRFRRPVFYVRVIPSLRLATRRQSAATHSAANS
ncbi:MAG TPA: glucan 1,4-alpha-glucosidase [Blastocatellia bacterium]|nr:glucan 1,4-alpha-glucosidase [Blastocatellia bacterium]